MNTIEIPAIGVCREIPSKWSEMTPEQARVTMRLLWDMESGLISPLEFHVRVLYLLLGIKRTWRSVMWEKLNRAVAEQKNANIFLLCENLLGWLFTDTEDGLLPTFDTIHNPLPEIHIGSHRLRGPADALQDLILVEFRNALIARDEFLNTRQPAALDRMIAFLYRQPRSKPTGPAGVSSPSVTRLLSGTYAVPAGCSVAETDDSHVVLRLRQISPDRDDSCGWGTDRHAHDLQQRNCPRCRPKFTLTDVAYELARDRALGTLNDIDEEGLYTIFQILHHNVKQAKRNAKTH
ncbi:MAG: hypothetical protein ACLS37_07040 [Alistipes sp.]